MQLSGELDYRIRYDVEHGLFHAQNVFNDEYIKPTFIEYVQNLEKENAELKMKIYGGGYEMIITKKDADIILLEKQLKEQKEHHKSVCETLTNMHRSLREQLSKAEEIILKLYNAGRGVLMCRAEEKAYDNLSNAINDKSIELFLEEIEK